MNKIIARKYYSMIYYLIASKLPCTYFPLGKIFTIIRAYCVRKMTGYECKGLEIESRVLIGNGRDVKIGNYCQINEECRLRNVEIGDNVMIAPQVYILHSGHEYKTLEIPMRFQPPKYYKKTIIEDDVWVGARAVIMHGVKIGRGSIIAAGSVVTRDIEPYSIVGGNPAKFIKSRIKCVE